MSNSIYNGPSTSFGTLVDGYVDYSEEVILRRAVPELRDGMKKVQRRILYAMHAGKMDQSLVKSLTIVGDAGKIHPHGDGSVYNAMCLMTDENGSNNISFIHGFGNLGKVYSSIKPAHQRYTKAMLNDFASDLFRDKDVMELIPSEEGDGVEPKVLNAIYPVILVNGASGIAVGTGTMMPSFNFNDVLELTIKRIKKGSLEIEDAIIPDFPTGGVLVCNREEIAKIMLTGVGKLKIRAKVEIEGNDILVKEVPIGKTAEGIVKAIEVADIKDIKEATATLGRNSPAHVVITCKTKRAVESVLMQLYQRNILQNTFSSNMLVVNGDRPDMLGVYGIIDEWYKWRKDVLKGKFERLIKDVQAEKHQLSSLMTLINNEEMKKVFVKKATEEGKTEATLYLKQVIPDVTNAECDWIYDRGLGVFHRGGSYANRLLNLIESEKAWNRNLSDLDTYIVNELEDLLAKRRDMFPRKTEVTYKDYRFSKISDSNEIEDDSFCVYTLMKNGFLTKDRYQRSGDDVFLTIEARANSILIGFDNYGRVLRVVGSEIPFTGSDNGVYLPKYFGVESDVEQEYGYRILYLSELDGSKKTLVYRDGYIGFFDTSEFVGKKNIKIINNGVCTAVRDQLLEVYEETEVPEYLLLADDTTDKIKLGVVVMNTVPERSRTSRAKVLSGTDINTKYLKGFNGFELAQYIENPDSLIGKLKVFKGEWYGEPEEIEDGFYLEYCKDIEE